MVTKIKRHYKSDLKTVLVIMVLMQVFGLSNVSSSSVTQKSSSKNATNGDGEVANIKDSNTSGDLENKSNSANTLKQYNLYNRFYTSSSEEWQRQCTLFNWSMERGCNISALLDKLLSEYDKRLRPLMDYRMPSTITVGFWILSIDSINVIDMDYQIDFFFRQSWNDDRLKHSYPKNLTLSNSMLDKIWIPDTYFENSKNSHFHSVTVPNKMLKITQDGTVIYNARISVRASCPMDLRMFPMDSQKCDLNIESYGYSNKDIVFEWEADKKKRISIGSKVRTLPQYNLTGLNASTHISEYIVGNYSRLTATFILERRTGYFFLHLYAPCALIVMISWISFCIPKESTAARVALGITSVLTITTILNMLNTAMPKVSYIKAVDWYLIVSFLFVFAVLIEYTLVLYLADKEKQSREEKKERTAKHTKRSDEKYSVDSNGHAIEKHHEIRSRNFTGTFKKEVHDGTKFPHKPLIVVLEDKHLSHPEAKCNQNDEHSSHTGRLFCDFRVDIIDEYSRMIFPLAFATFNVVYWLLFYSKKNDSRLTGNNT